MPAAGAPDIQRAFGLDHATTATTLFLVPAIAGFVVEPVVYLLADRYPRRWFVAGGFAAMALAALVAAVAPSPLVLAIALAVWYCASGAAVPLAQTTLVDARPDERARTMTRWSLWSVAGDVAAPLALAGFAAIGLSWRAGFALVGALLAAWAVALAARPLPAAQVDEAAEDRVSTWQALRAALADRVLIAWLFGVALCDLLDEILVVFASLHVRIALGASPAWQAAILAAFMLGSAGGLVAIDRLLATRGERGLLVACGLTCAACYAAWLAAPALWLSAVLALPVGATAAPLYPLAAARAYARCPGRSAIVLVGQHVFTPLGLALPPLLGVVADHAGTHVALALLIVQPIALALLAAATRR